MKKVVLYDSFQFGKGKMLKLHMEKIQDIKEEIESDGNEIIGEFYDKCNEFLRPEKRPEYLRLYELCNTDEVNELYVISFSRFSIDIRSIVQKCIEMHEMGVKVNFVTEKFSSEELVNSKLVEYLNGAIKQEMGM